MIFGASGDLTQRKLFPALYALAYRRLLPERFAVVGVSRSEQTTAQFVAAMKQAVERHGRDPFNQRVWDSLTRGMRYVSADFADETAEDDLDRVLSELEAKHGLGGNRVYYLAIPPQAFETSVQEIGERQDHQGWTRVIVEKPFGHDAASARKLSELLHRWFREDEIFRIDHYLGKETVQNMLALRFANGIFEPVWNRQFIDHVQITVAESMGIEGRAAFYERAGAIRDVFQNHLLQLLALTAMEPPIDFAADAVRTEKVKALRSLHTPGPEVGRPRPVRPWVDRGGGGARLPRGGRCRAGVAHRDVRRREALRRQLALGGHAVLRPRRQAARTPRDDDRDPVPARAAPAVRGGRRRGPSPQRAPHPRAARRGGLARDRRQGARAPGCRSARCTWTSSTAGAFREALPEAYERLILDAMLGDATLFTREDEVDEQWKLVDAIVGAVAARPPELPELRGRQLGPAGGGRASSPRRQVVAEALTP